MFQRVAQQRIQEKKLKTTKTKMQDKKEVLEKLMARIREEGEEGSLWEDSDDEYESECSCRLC